MPYTDFESTKGGEIRGIIYFVQCHKKDCGVKMCMSMTWTAVLAA